MLRNVNEERAYCLAWSQISEVGTYGFGFPTSRNGISKIVGNRGDEGINWVTAKWCIKLL
jgi:hypothetical protein